MEYYLFVSDEFIAVISWCNYSCSRKYLPNQSIAISRYVSYTNDFHLQFSLDAFYSEMFLCNDQQ